MCGEEHAVLSPHGSAMGCRHVSKSSVAAVWDEPSRAAALQLRFVKGLPWFKAPFLSTPCLNFVQGAGCSQHFSV